MNGRRISGIAAMAALAWNIMGATAQTTFTWSGGGSSDSVSDTGNWGGLNGNQHGIQSFAGTTRLAPVFDGSGTLNTHRIYFQANAGAFVLSGRDLGLNDHGGADPTIRNLGTNTQTIMNNLIGDSSADDPLRVQANAGSIVLMGNITNRGSAMLIEGGSAHRVALGGTVTGNPNIEINGAQLHILEGGNIDQVGGGIFVGLGTSTNTSAAFYIADQDGGTTVAKALNVNAGSGASGNRMIGANNVSGTNVYSGNIVRGSSGNRTLTLAQTGGGTVDFDGVISGDHKVLVEGPGTVRLGGANTFAANTEINGGQLHVKEGATISAAGQTVYVGHGSTTGTSAGLFIADVNGGTTVAQTLRINPGDGANRTLGGLNVSGTNTYSGAVNMTGTGDRSATLHAAAGGTVAFTGTLSGDAGIFIEGGGTVLLGAANDYTGPTVVSDGTLRVANASGSGTGSGAVTVRDGGRLGGSGSILTSSLLVEYGGSIAPDTLGTLSVDLGLGGTAMFETGAYFTFTLAAAGLFDQVEFQGTGGVTFNNNVIHFVDMTGGELEMGGTYELFRFGDNVSRQGQLTIGSGLEAYGGSTLSFNGDVLQLLVNPIPEPSTMALLGLGAAALAAVRRRRKRAG